ncbi:TetR/AcrR family transcriptional regulator [Actinomadura atramentaria]|uniref:TetR/AcrR family transcriptional regulator n=1 Tax=Actinomadura atramentaria TaxID=1990 RepID=UPI0003A655EA|nr:TetR/AcrR family transcriptional regulator [Actinomadura atramentaria]
MTDTSPAVAAEIVAAAVRLARSSGRDVADVPAREIAAEAGISRSTLMRRLGGSRRALDDAVRALGIDPGGQRPVRDRAIDAGARLIGEQGLAALTLEAIASRAGCSVHSLYDVFGGRDELLGAIYERHSPLPDLEHILDGSPRDLADTVREIYRMLTVALTREPRIMPAMFADALARPGNSPFPGLARQLVPRVLAVLGPWLAAEVDAGRIRPMPTIMLFQQLAAPMLMHFLTRPALETVPGVDLPDPDRACDGFAAAFLRAAALPPHDQPPSRP